MIQLLTFDLDNTLWDVNPVIQQAERAMLEFLASRFPAYQSQLGRAQLWHAREHVVRTQPHLQALPTRLRKAVLQHCFQHAGLPAEAIETAVEDTFAVFIEQRNRIDLFPETRPLLTRLTQQFALIALSNGNADLQRIGLDRFFVAHFSAESTGQPKPHPAMFKAALNHAQVAPQQCIHIGDHPLEDVAAAQRVGMCTVWFNPQGIPRPPDCAPDAEIQQLGDLPAAIAELQGKTQA